MKKLNGTIFIIVAMIIFATMVIGCGGSEQKDREVVNKQQEHYAKTQPVPYYDYSIPRDVLIQIYNVVTQESRNTYTVIESVTGEVKFHGPSIGYGIPADTSLTNPLQPARSRYGAGYMATTIEQAEPNGLFPSKNTDGTWVLFIDSDGGITPVYTEHKVTTFPFAVKQNDKGEWVRANDSKASITVTINKSRTP